MTDEDHQMATPLEISIGLWYFVRPGDYGLNNGDNNFEAPAVWATFQRFVDAGLLRHCDSGERNYEPNEPALKAWVQALCAVPFPVVKWIVEPEPRFRPCPHGVTTGLS